MAYAVFSINLIMNIYIAGALFSIAEQNFNQQLKEELIKINPNLNILLPQDEAKKLVGKPNFENLVFKSCHDEVVKADIILAILEGPDIDSGTCIELGLAYALKKKIIGIRTDFRGSEIEGLNIMVRKILSHYIYSTKGTTIIGLAEKVNNVL